MLRFFKSRKKACDDAQEHLREKMDDNTKAAERIADSAKRLREALDHLGPASDMAGLLQGKDT